MPAAVLPLAGDGTTSAPAYRVYLVSKTGAVLATLSNEAANIALIEDELNGPGSCTVEIPATTALATVSDVLAKEIQVWREGRCIFWGPIVRADAGIDKVSLQCRGLLWYYDRRFFGTADRPNLLTNPEFESDLTGWTASGVTASAVTSHRTLGAKSCKLVQANAGVDTYEYQSFAHTGTGVGTLLTVAGWFYLQDGGYVGPALDSRGLYIEIQNGATIDAYDFSIIDGDTPRNVWQRAETQVWLPPNTTRTINVRLYAPGGTIFWDAITCTRMESFTALAEDQAQILQYVSDYAQDNFAFTHGKSDLNITATSTTCPPTGVTRDYFQQFADHANIGDSIRQFSELSDGVDISVEFTGTTRAFHTWYPNKGTDRTATVTISEAMLAGGSAPFGYRFDGEQAADSVVVLGDGDGPDREEGGATDTSAFGGTTYEAVVSAEPGTAIDRLDTRATELLRALKQPESITVSVHEPSADLLKTVVVGDSITLDITHGFIQATGGWRVVARKFAPGSEALTFECNRA